MRCKYGGRSCPKKITERGQKKRRKREQCSGEISKTFRERNFFRNFFRERLKYILLPWTFNQFFSFPFLFLLSFFPKLDSYVSKEKEREREEIVIELRLPLVTNIKSRFLPFPNFREETRRTEEEEGEEEELMQIVQNLSRS